MRVLVFDNLTDYNSTLSEINAALGFPNADASTYDTPYFNYTDKTQCFMTVTDDAYVVLSSVQQSQVVDVMTLDNTWWSPLTLAIRSENGA